MKNLKLISLWILLASVFSIGAKQDDVLYKFDFGNGKVKSGYTKVGVDAYNKTNGYGVDFETVADAVTRTRGGDLNSDFLTGNLPFYFSVDLPEGNYKVTVTLGDAEEATETVIKAESRRLMFDVIKTKPGEFVTRTFVLNIRTPKIDGGTSIGLNRREYGKLDWDDKLTVEFNGARPCVTSMIIEKASQNTVTVFLTGDSTVVDQDEEPWNSWGQMLTRFFNTRVSVANYAESGQSTYSSISSRRLEKISRIIKKGDYLFIQFGHNDMKRTGEGIGAYTSYKDNLKKFIEVAQSNGATPVLITSMHRRTFDDNGKITNSFGDYIDAVRQTAREESVMLIDLNAVSKVLYETWGPEACADAFVDGTHHNNYGSYELAKCIINGIIDSKMPLAKDIAKDYKRFDPAHPDDLTTFYMPASPRFSMEKPLGN